MKSLLKWLLSLFNKKIIFVPLPVEVPETPELPEEPVKIPPKTSDIEKISIIVGHGHGDPGASSWNNVDEFDYNNAVAKNLVAGVTGKRIKVFKRGASGITGVALMASAWGPDLTIELHLNAFNGKAKGCEVLVLNKDRESAKIARLFALAFCKKFGRIMRGEDGINWIDSSDRGYTSLRAVSLIKRSILVEPFFCDTESEWIPVETYSKFLIDWIEGL